MKKLVRKLFMWAFHDELLEVARYARRGASGLDEVKGLIRCGEIKGALFTLEKLDLLMDSKQYVKNHVRNYRDQEEDGNGRDE